MKSSSVPVIAISNIKDKASILSSVAAAGVNKSKSKPLVLDDNMGIVISSGGKNGTSNDKPLGTHSLTSFLPYSLTHSLMQDIMAVQSMAKLYRITRQS